MEDEKFINIRRIRTRVCHAKHTQTEVVKSKYNMTLGFSIFINVIGIIYIYHKKYV